MLQLIASAQHVQQHCLKRLCGCLTFVQTWIICKCCCSPPTTLSWIWASTTSCCGVKEVGSTKDDPWDARLRFSTKSRLCKCLPVFWICRHGKIYHHYQFQSPRLGAHVPPHKSSLFQYLREHSQI